jgi:hypothetical protein
MIDYQSHPAAELFPMMPPDQYEAFKEDVQKNGFQQDVVVYQGQILDGRNRYKAAIELDMLDDLPIAEMDDDTQIDPFQWVISRNLHRRHLTESQRAMVASKLAKLQRGDNQHTKEDGPIGPPSIEKAAEQLQVGKTSVKRAKSVQEHGSPELIAAVEQGEITVSKAATIAKTVPKERQLDEAKKPKPKPQKPKQATKEIKQEAKNESKRFKDQKAERQPSGDDEYDYPLVEAFKVADYRLNTLKKIIDTLEPFEVAIVRDWAIGRLG